MKKIYFEEEDFMDSDELREHKKLNKLERKKLRDKKVVEQMYDTGQFGG